MFSLAIDTLTSGISFALAKAGRVQGQVHHALPRGQDAQLIPLLQEFLAANNTSFDQLERVAALRGPGSFTGIRLGLAAAQGLGAALNIPVLGLNRLAIYNQIPVPDDLRRVIVLQSRRDELFCSEDGHEMMLLSAPQISHSYVGKGWHILCDEMVLLTKIFGGTPGDAPVARSASCVGPLEVGQAAIIASTAPAESIGGFPATPLYGRAADVSCGPRPSQTIVTANS